LIVQWVRLVLSFYNRRDQIIAARERVKYHSSKPSGCVILRFTRELSRVLNTGMGGRAIGRNFSVVCFA